MPSCSTASTGLTAAGPEGGEGQSSPIDMGLLQLMGTESCFEEIFGILENSGDPALLQSVHFAPVEVTRPAGLSHWSSPGVPDTLGTAASPESTHASPAGPHDKDDRRANDLLRVAYAELYSSITPETGSVVSSDTSMTAPETSGDGCCDGSIDLSPSPPTAGTRLGNGLSPHGSDIHHDWRISDSSSSTRDLTTPPVRVSPSADDCSEVRSVVQPPPPAGRQTVAMSDVEAPCLGRRQRLQSYLRRTLALTPAMLRDMPAAKHDRLPAGLNFMLFRHRGAHGPLPWAYFPKRMVSLMCGCEKAWVARLDVAFYRVCQWLLLRPRMASRCKAIHAGMRKALWEHRDAVDRHGSREAAAVVRLLLRSFQDINMLIKSRRVHGQIVHYSFDVERGQFPLSVTFMDAVRPDLYLLTMDAPDTDLLAAAFEIGGRITFQRAQPLDV